MLLCTAPWTSILFSVYFFYLACCCPEMLHACWLAAREKRKQVYWLVHSTHKYAHAKSQGKWMYESQLGISTWGSFFSNPVRLYDVQYTVDVCMSVLRERESETEEGQKAWKSRHKVKVKTQRPKRYCWQRGEKIIHLNEHFLPGVKERSWVIDKNITLLVSQHCFCSTGAHRWAHSDSWDSTRPCMWVKAVKPVGDKTVGTIW